MRTVSKGFLPENGVPRTRERAHEETVVQVRPLQQILSLQEEPDQSPANATCERFASRAEERRDTEARVHDLPGRFRAEILPRKALETTARFARENEASVRSLRSCAVFEEEADGAQTRPR